MRRLARASVSTTLLLLAACAGGGPSNQVPFSAAPPSTLRLFGSLVAPPGIERAPAVVLLHGSSDLASMPQLFEYQQKLASEGIASLLFDSWEARGMGSPAMTGYSGDVLARAYAGRILDAYGAVRYLRSAPGIDPDRIAVMGLDDGGRVALHVAAGVGADGRPYRDVPPPRASVAYYPSCLGVDAGRAGPGGPGVGMSGFPPPPMGIPGPPGIIMMTPDMGMPGPLGIPPAQGMGTSVLRAADLATVKVPLLIHVAGADDQPGATAALCAPVYDRLVNSGGPVEIHRYPNAYHLFDDSRIVQRGGRAIGGYDGQATELAWQRTMAFLRQRLDLPTGGNP